MKTNSPRNINVPAAGRSPALGGFIFLELSCGAVLKSERIVTVSQNNITVPIVG